MSKTLDVAKEIFQRAFPEAWWPTTKASQDRIVQDVAFVVDAPDLDAAVAILTERKWQDPPDAAKRLREAAKGMTNA